MVQKLYKHEEHVSEPSKIDLKQNESEMRRYSGAVRLDPRPRDNEKV